jgi:uncharacterized protein YidB (DUF937 family)
MGLLDILNGMAQGPRGPSRPTPQPTPQSQRPSPTPSSPSSPGARTASSGSMSPLMMALIGVLAYKAIKSFGGGQPGATPGGAPLPGGTTAGAPGGGLGDILGSLLGGGPATPGGGPSPGSVLSGGLGNLIKDLQNAGQGRVAQSWIGTGPNEAIDPDDLSKALGSDTIKALSARTGLAPEELLEGLSDQLPELVNQLTPEGRMPTQQEASRW